MRLRGWLLFVEVIAAVRKRPRTARALAPLFAEHVAIGPLRRLLRRLVDHRILRIARWTGDKNKERVYGFGPGPSAPGSRLPSGSATSMWVVDRFAAVWEALTTPASVPDVTEETGSSIGNVRRAMRRMHELRLLRIADWQRQTANGPRTAIYVRGQRKDAPYPPLISDRESYLRQKERAEARRLHQAFTFRGVAAQPEGAWA